MKPTEALAKYVAEAKFSDFPPEVVLKAKYCILDALGCALGGVQTKIGQQHLGVARALGGTPESTLAGDGNRISMPLAAYTNSQIGNVLDYDDAVIPVPGHPGITIVHPALAAGERANASGKEVITAVILGYEVGLRVAHALRSVVMPAGSRHPFLLFNTSYKILAAAATAGKLLGLDKDGLINSFGIAGGVAPGTVQPTWAAGGHAWGNIKANYGIYALLGSLAALQASQGFYADREVLDGDDFWTKSGAHSCNHLELTRGLGNEYLILEVGFKPVPSCRGTHPQLTAVIEALNGESLNVNDIEEITVYGGRMLTRSEWHNMVEAEFSTACAISLYLSKAEPGPSWYTGNQFQSREVLDLARKIKFVEELTYWEIWIRYGKLAAAAEIKTKDGKVRKAYIEYPKGEPQYPLTEEEHRRKFLGNVNSLIPREQSKKLYNALIHFEDGSARELMELSYRK